MTSYLYVKQDIERKKGREKSHRVEKRKVRTAGVGGRDALREEIWLKRNGATHSCSGRYRARSADGGRGEEFLEDGFI